MKNFLKQVIKGIPYGIAMLALSYVFVYLVDEKSVYISELSKIKNAKFLIYQMIFSSILYMVFFGTM